MLWTGKRLRFNDLFKVRCDSGLNLCHPIFNVIGANTECINLIEMAFATNISHQCSERFFGFAIKNKYLSLSSYPRGKPAKIELWNIVVICF